MSGTAVVDAGGTDVSFVEVAPPGVWATSPPTIGGANEIWKAPTGVWPAAGTTIIDSSPLFPAANGSRSADQLPSSDRRNGTAAIEH